MKSYIAIFSLALLACTQQVSAQQPLSRLQKKMIKFLINHKQLENIGDTSNISSYEGYRYDREVLKIKTKGKTSTIYAFGSTSPHGKEYIALNDATGLIMLETKDMPKEINSILIFFKRNRATGQMILKTLPMVSNAYQQNIKTYRPQVEN